MTTMRLAAAPISWGICEVPGWGEQLPPARVLSEMRALGLTATELGAAGYLPEDPAALSALLHAHGLELVGGFVPLVLHEASAAFEAARATAAAMAAAGATTFVLAVVADEDWGPRFVLSEEQLGRLAAHVGELDDLVRAEGLELALHPHAGTLVETADDVERVLAASPVGWCLDTGHLAIGGVDPVAFAREHGDRVVHVHLKDVDDAVAARYRAGELTLMGAVQAGLFRPLGTGDAGIADVVSALRENGYDGWWVLEQDAALTGATPPAGTGPVEDVRRSLDFLAALDG